VRGLIRRAFDAQLREPEIAMSEFLFRWRTVQHVKAGVNDPFADPTFQPRLTHHKPEPDKKP